MWSKIRRYAQRRSWPILILTLISFEIESLSMAESPIMVGDCGTIKLPPLKESEAGNCPAIEKGILLHRLYPAHGLLAGFSNRPEHRKFLAHLLDVIPEDLPTMVFAPAADIELASSDMVKANFGLNRKLGIESFVGEEFLWVQDLFKIATKANGTKEILDLPYPEEDSDVVPVILGAKCNVPAARSRFREKAKRDPETGDFGGNVYPLTDQLVLIGDNMSVEVEEELNEKLDQSLLRLSTSWLETGHVDEIVSLLPNPKNEVNGICSFGVAYPSPLLAMNLIKLDRSERIELSNFLPSMIESSKKYRNCIDTLAANPKADFSIEACDALREMNREVEKLLVRELALLKQAVKDLEDCNLEMVIPVPVIFTPLDNPIEPENVHLMRPINGNAINNILIHDQIYFPKQFYGPFEEYLSQIGVLNGLNPVFLDIFHLHELGGGIHCATQVVRGCK